MMLRVGDMQGNNTQELPAELQCDNTAIRTVLAKNKVRLEDPVNNNAITSRFTRDAREDVSIAGT